MRSFFNVERTHMLTHRFASILCVCFSVSMWCVHVFVCWFAFNVIHLFCFTAFFLRAGKLSCVHIIRCWLCYLNGSDGAWWWWMVMYSVVCNFFYSLDALFNSVEHAPKTEQIYGFSCSGQYEWYVPQMFLMYMLLLLISLLWYTRQ